MPQKNPTPPRIAALSLELSTANEFRLFPAGEFRARDGRPTDVPTWRMDAQIAQALITQVAAAGVDYVIDYHHQTLYAAQSGQAAPAAGWFGALEWRDGDGLYVVDAKWTERATGFIESDEFRYISPVFTYDQTGAPQVLLHVAITNTPALGNQDALTAAVAASLTLSPEPVPMNEELLEHLRWLLNLPVGATADDISAQLQKLIDQVKGSGAVAVAAAGFDLGAHLASQGQKIASLQAAVPDMTRFVALEAHTALQGELAALQSQVDSAQRNALLEQGLADGRITPATKDYWSTQPTAALSAFLEIAPKIAALQNSQTGGRAPDATQPAADNPKAIAQAALQYQGQQKAIGIQITTAQAVAHVTKGA